MACLVRQSGFRGGREVRSFFGRGRLRVASSCLPPHLVDLSKAGGLQEDRTNTKAATVSVVCSPLPNCGTQVTRVIFGYESDRVETSE